MNFDWFHATQVEESDNHALFFECKRRHLSIKNTTATRPRHKQSTGSTVLPLGLAQPKEQPRLLQQLSRFCLLPFSRKKLGYLRTGTPLVQWVFGLERPVPEADHLSMWNRVWRLVELWLFHLRFHTLISPCGNFIFWVDVTPATKKRSHLIGASLKMRTAELENLLLVSLSYSIQN